MVPNGWTDVRLTEQTRYALRVLATMAARDPVRMRVSELSAATGISEFNIFKLLKIVTRAGFVRSSRGRNGGVRLATPPTELSVGRVVRALEPRFQICGPAAVMADANPVAELDRRVDQAIGRGIGVFLAELDAITIADLLRRNALDDHRRGIVMLTAAEG
jgi:Rrf2 family protein